MQSSVESSGYFENFSSDLDDYDLEEDDFFASNLSFNGRLVISGEPSVWPLRGTGGRPTVLFPEDPSSDCEDDDQTDSICKGHGISVGAGPQNIKFEVFSTRIHEGKGKQCVFYSLMVLKTDGVDVDKAMIERRYSDFATLYKALKKDHPSLLEKVAFPGKVFGRKSNINPEVIEARQSAFESFLQKIYHHKEVCLHPAFREFFFLPELREATENLKGGELKHSLKLLLNSLHLQMKLCDQVREIIATLSAIVVIHEAQSKFEEAERYATVALELIQEANFSSYLIPLMDTAVKLKWKLQKDKTALEKRLVQAQRTSGIDVDCSFTLRELAVTRFNK